MAWWGGDDSSDSSSSSSATTFTDDTSGGMSSDMGSMGGGAGMGDMQQFSVALQQQVLVQHVISELTDRAFAKCLTSKPSDSTLSGTQAACVHATVNKWMDTNDFMMGRMAKKQQQQQGSFQ